VNVGWAFLAFVLLNISVNTILSFIDSFFSIKKFYRKWRYGKKSKEDDDSKSNNDDKEKQYLEKEKRSTDEKDSDNIVMPQDYIYSDINNREVPFERKPCALDFDSPLND
jgi:hypothetical protein